MNRFFLALLLCPALLAAQYTVQHDATTKKIVAPTNILGMTFGGQALTNLVGTGLTNSTGELRANLKAGTNIVFVTNLNQIEINTPASGSGSSVFVNHAAVADPNFTNSTDIAWTVVGSNVTLMLNSVYQPTNAALTALSLNPQLYQATNGNLTLLSAYGPTTWQATNVVLTTLAALGTNVWQYTNSTLTRLAGVGVGTSGDMLYHDGVGWTNLAIGTDDQVLAVASGFPSWETISDVPVVRTIYTNAGSYTHTYTYPTGAHCQVHVYGVTPGAGGGSGRKGAAGSDRYGGGGGGGGLPIDLWFDRDDLGATSDTVILGSPGTGGTAVTTDSTSGNAGNNAGVTSFAGIGDSYAARGGSGGTAASGAAGAYHTTGAASSVSATPGTGLNVGRLTYHKFAAGGGAGGGVDAANTQRAGSSGGASYNTNPATAAGTGGAAGGTNGGDGGDVSAWAAIGGSAGGGGGGNSGASKGGDGGDGGNWGAGGGGGGAGTDTGDGTGGSGAGGDGAPGIIIVDEYPAWGSYPTAPAGAGDDVWVNHANVVDPNFTNHTSAEITWGINSTNVYPELAASITRDAEVATWITVSTNLVPNLSLVSFAGQDQVLTNSLLMSAMTGTRLAVFNASSYLTNSTLTEANILIEAEAQWTYQTGSAALTNLSNLDGSYLTNSVPGGATNAYQFVTLEQLQGAVRGGEVLYLDNASPAAGFTLTGTVRSTNYASLALPAATTNAAITSADGTYVAGYISTNTYSSVASGLATVEIYAYENSAGAGSIKAEIYIVNSVTKAEEYEFTPSPAYQTVPATSTPTKLTFSIPITDYSSTTNFHIIVKIKVSESGVDPTIRLVTGGTFNSHVSFALAASSFVKKAGDTMTGLLSVPALVATDSIKLSAATASKLAAFDGSSYLTNSTIADTDVLTTSSIDYVTAASMADADHGEVVWSGGVATIDKTEWDSMTITNLSVGDLNMTSGTMRLPNTSSDESLSNSGGVNLNTTDEQLTVHSAADGEISGEVSLSLIKTFAITFDPDAICDGAVDSLFLMWLGDEAPEGIIIDEWKISFEANPTTEIDADLCYADAMIGKANEVIVDAVDTTDGTATEDTDANINSGNAVPNGKVLYLDINTAYTESGHQVLFQMWYHYEAD